MPAYFISLQERFIVWHFSILVNFPSEMRSDSAAGQKVVAHFHNEKVNVESAVPGLAAVRYLTQEVPCAVGEEVV